MAEATQTVESVEYDVTLVIRLSTSVYFAPIHRDGPITKFDAIENAWGQMPEDARKAIEGGFDGEFEVELSAETLRREL